MEQSREELEQKLAKATAKLEQYQHQIQRLENRYHDHQESRRKKRNHRLITRGGAVESVAPDIKGMSEKQFYGLMKKVFSLPEVNALVSDAVTPKESD